MIRYAEERFLNIELIMEDESGLKIPKSSVVNEKFFISSERIHYDRRKQQRKRCNACKREWERRISRRKYL